MKKALLLAAITACLLLTSTVLADTGAVDIWHFDEGNGTIAYDSSGNGNNGTINGATWTNNCVSGSCSSFNGNGYVSVPKTDLLQASNIHTISLWLKFNSFPSNQVFFASDIDDSGSSGWAFLLSSTHYLQHAFWGSSSYISSTAPLSTGVWYNVVWVSDQGNTENWLYINGVLNNSNSNANIPIDNSNIVGIGGTPLSSGSKIDGIIDEVAIYNYARTPEEIWNDYVKYAPNITILSPQNTTYSKTYITLNFTVSKPTSWIGYNLNNTANVTISGPVNMTGLANGWNNITIYANDSSGNMGSSFVKFFYCLGDVNVDKKIDMSDIAVVSRSFGSVPGSPNWNPAADINGDGKIDIRDVAIVSQQFGKICS